MPFSSNKDCTCWNELVKVVPTKSVYDLGQVHLQKYMVEKQLKSIENEIKIAEQHIETLSKSEKEFSDSLIEKYGGTSVDLETGIIVPQ